MSALDSAHSFINEYGSTSNNLLDEDIVDEGFNEYKLKSAIMSLSNNSNIIISNLSKGSKIYNDYFLVKTNVELLYGTKQYEVIERIVKDCHWPSIVKPGTIGSFLFGCFQSTYGDVDKRCSPLCVNNILPYSSTTNFPSVCNHQIWTQISEDEGERFELFSSKSSNPNNKAYIYVNDKFESFTRKELYQLRKNNVKVAQLLNTKNSRHYALTRMVKLNELPVEKHVAKYIGCEPKSNNYIVDKYIKPNSYAVIVVIVAIILFVIFILMVLMM